MDLFEKLWAKAKRDSANGAIGLGIFILILAFCIIAISIDWGIGTYLWNTVLAEAIDGIHKLTFWQFGGISILSHMLIKATIHIDREG